MASVSARLLRVGLALGTAAGACLASAWLPVAAAEGDGLGGGGAAFAFNYVNWVSIALAFIFGFALRDAIARRWARMQARKKAKAAKAAPASPRA